MMKIKNIIIILIFLNGIFILPLNSNNQSVSKQSQLNQVEYIAVVFSVGGLGDKSFNDAAYEGLIRANDTYNLNISYVEPTTVAEINASIETYASSTDPVYDLIIAIGYSAFDGINASALAHPSRNFAIIDAVVDLPNVASIIFKEHEGSFLAGALATMVSETQNIAFLGGMNISLINKFRSGYEEGARYINPDIIIQAAYSPNQSNPFGDIEGGKTVTENFINQGADIIFTAAGPTGLGTFEAVDEANQTGKRVFAIGVDVNQDNLYSGLILTSMLKRMDVVVETQIKALVEGTWDNGTLSLGLAEDGVGITNMDFTTSERDAFCTKDTSKFDVIQNLRNNIITGLIVVNETLQDISTYNKVSHLCDSMNIAVVFATSGLGDNAYNDATYEGLIRANDSYNLNIDYIEPTSITEVNDAIETYASSTDPIYDLIITIGWEAVNGVNTSALAHPDRNFTIIDAVVNQPNVASVTFREEEGSFLAGAMAAMVSKTQNIAFLGGMDTPLINHFRSGYEQGARYINPDIIIQAAYSPNQTNPWNDTEGGSAVADSFIDNGVDIVYTAAGLGTGLGVFDAVEAANYTGKRVYAIGVDFNQDSEKEGLILTSMVKKYDNAIESQISAIFEGTWVSGSIYNLGLAEDGVGITDMEFTTFERDVVCTLGKTRYEIVLELAEDIRNGIIIVDPEIQDPANYNTVPHYCDSFCKNIAVVFGVGGLGDEGFNDLAYKGLMNANDTFCLNIDYTEPTTITEFNSAIETFASSTNPVYDLIIAVGWEAGDAVDSSARAHPDRNFVIFDNVVDLPNVASIIFKEHEGSFLAGAMAAMATKTNKLGFLGGLDIELINRFRSGFEQGARYINPDIEIFVQYSPNQNNPWGDREGGRAVANSFIDDGVDIIYSAAGVVTGSGVFEAVEVANQTGIRVFAIGVDVNQDDLYPGLILTSMLKRLDVAIETQITSFVEGTWTSGYLNLGLAEGGVGITLMENTTFERDVICTLGKTRYEIVLELAEDIRNGLITVDPEIQNSANYNTVPHYCDDFCTNIAVVFASGGLGDQGFNDMAFEGLLRANNTYCLNIEYVETEDILDTNSAIESFASSTNPVYDLIIGIGWSTVDGINTAALAHPDKQFMITDAVVDQPNVASIIFKEEQGSFLAGAMAAMTTKTNKLGFLGGLDIPLINRFRSGFEQGARYINPDIEIFVQYSPNVDNAWNDRNGGKVVANSFIDQGADVIYTAADATGLGVFDAVKEVYDAGGPKVYAIGVDFNHDSFYQGLILTSMLKNLDIVIEIQIKAFKEGTWTNGIISLGLEEEVVGITDMEFTTDERDAICSDGKTRHEIILDLTEAIINGVIIVDPEIQEPDDFNTIPHTCDECVDCDTTAPLITANITDSSTLSGTVIIAISSDEVGSGSLFIDTISLSSLVFSGSCPCDYVVTFDTSLFADGSHVILITATDEAGNEFTGSINIIISNQAPSTTSEPSDTTTTTSEEDGFTSTDAPGFELVILFFTIVCLSFISRKRRLK
ncbi:MAG: BMP family lipoprotein [Candidatus Hodarchaeales archaeon]|jgi:basic membrane protein A